LLAGLAGCVGICLVFLQPGSECRLPTGGRLPCGCGCGCGGARLRCGAGLCRC
jgi:hypothetical protein